MLAASEHDFIDLHTQHFTRVYRYIAYRINDLPRAEELARTSSGSPGRRSRRNRPA
jgi:hypothetical protein